MLFGDLARLGLEQINSRNVIWIGLRLINKSRSKDEGVGEFGTQ